MRERYLFIRLLEACNAGCFMCGYAHSRDPYRLSLEEFRQVLEQASDLGIAYVRFTGGEPLLHKNIKELIAAGTAAGMKMSIITNGRLLPRMIEHLAKAGLKQVIASVDGASADSHDRYRNTHGLFDACITGLRMARDLGLQTRVNTVVGPHNYAEMPALQRLLGDLGVVQWELSAVKLEQPATYPDPLDVQTRCEPLYQADPALALVPMGKRFYGESADERSRFFAAGVMPRPAPPKCYLIGDVLYLDAKAGRGFGCSLLPHRDESVSGNGVVMRKDGRWHLREPDFDRHVAVFRDFGPEYCRGCSTTAAGYSDDVAAGKPLGYWHF